MVFFSLKKDGQPSGTSQDRLQDQRRRVLVLQLIIFVPVNWRLKDAAHSHTLMQPSELVRQSLIDSVLLCLIRHERRERRQSDLPHRQTELWAKEDRGEVEEDEGSVFAFLIQSSKARVEKSF